MLATLYLHCFGPGQEDIYLPEPHGQPPQVQQAMVTEKIRLRYLTAVKFMKLRRMSAWMLV